MKEITVRELRKLMDNGADYQLIDIREAYEIEICQIGGESIPLHEIPHCVERLSKTKKVILHCRSGARSSNAIKWLEKNHQLDNLYNLKGGILAWIDEIDPQMTKY